jgi:PAS domain S-box-containing protein
MKTALLVTDAGLKAKADEVRQILDTSATGITRCSRDLRFLSANAAIGTLVGLPVEQIIGRPMVDVMGVKAFEVIRPYVERVLRGERVEYEEEFTYAPGWTKFMHVVYTPWIDSEGHVAGWVASVSDITDLKRTTKALRESEEPSPGDEQREYWLLGLGCNERASYVVAGTRRYLRLGSCRN